MSETKLIYKKMSLVMSEIGSVGKNSVNSAQGYKFRSIDSMVNALNPALVKHGVFMTPRVVSERTEIREVTRSNGKAGVDKHVALLVEFEFYAEDGSSVVVGPIASEGLDSGDKATNKALSAALKYALIQTFCVPTEDMVDADLTTPEITTRSSVSAKIAKEAEEFLNNGASSVATTAAKALSEMATKAPEAPLPTFKRQLGPKTNGATPSAPVVSNGLAKTTVTDSEDYI